MLEINNLNISIKDRKYLDNFNLVLKDNDKAAIIGEEGNGKSTLLKTIINKADYAITQGLINTHNCHIGYMPQKIEYQGSVFDYLFSTEYDYETAQSTLYRELDFLNLQPELIYRDMETLSGGEKVK
ncbi:MAG: ATP-binding cassette domain-containing protein, partial [Solobacterium sp.]|nr:ATP-binding cassette domain-containing protein [Solobacterium sp.]